MLYNVDAEECKTPILYVVVLLSSIEMTPLFALNIEDEKSAFIEFPSPSKFSESIKFPEFKIKFAFLTALLRVTFDVESLLMLIVYPFSPLIISLIETIPEFFEIISRLPFVLEIYIASNVFVEPFVM